MQTQELLQNLIQLLMEENKYLIESIKNKKVSEQLLDVVKKKEKLIYEILLLDKKAVEPFEEELRQIDEWTQRNKSLAINNIEFINEIFDAIYSQNVPPKYTKDGKISTVKEGLFNKKA